MPLKDGVTPTMKETVNMANRVDDLGLTEEFITGWVNNDIRFNDHLIRRIVYEGMRVIVEQSNGQA